MNRSFFGFIRHSIYAVCLYLRLALKVFDLPTIDIDHIVKAHGEVFAICEATVEAVCIESVSGISRYSTGVFAVRGIDVEFLKVMPLVYPQFGKPFVPWLSILDVMMFNRREVTEASVKEKYTLI